MVRSIFKLFSVRPWYRRFVIGMFLSGIGSGLTQTAVYSELATLRAGTYSFGIAFAASLLPGVISSYFGAKLTKLFGPFVVLLIAEIGGAMSLIVPALGYREHVIQLLGVSTFLPGLFGGLCVGAASQMAKSNFSDHEYPAIAALDAVLFTGNVILANGLGAVLVSLMPFNDFLMFDALTYCVGAFSLWSARHYVSRTRQPPQASPAKVRRRFTYKQRRAFVAMPLMAAVSAPGMALLPAYGSHLGMVQFGAMAVSCTATLLFARSLGQLIGPFVIRIDKINAIFSSSPKIFGLITTFVILYAAAFSVENVWVSFVFIAVAHVATNILFVVVEASLFSSFEEDSFASVMVSRHQLQVVVMALVGLAVTLVATYMPIRDAYLLFAIPALCVFVLLLKNPEKLTQSAS